MGLAPVTSESCWPKPPEPGLGEAAIASMVLGAERGLNECLLNDFQLIDES